MDESDARTILTAPARQPPVDEGLIRIARDVHSALSATIRRLLELPTFPTDQERSVWVWHMALSTIAWDVGGVAIDVSAFSPSMRAARALNRMLLEYAARVHFYVAQPALAEQHYRESPNMLRRVMKPLAQHASSDANLGGVKELLDSGTTKASQPSTREMLTAMVSSFVADSAKRSDFVKFLESEYVVGNGYIHGSQSAFFDIFEPPTLHPRSRVLYRKAEVLRSINCLLALLVGVEKQYGFDCGVEEFVAALRINNPYEDVVSMGTHDTLASLLGIRIAS